MAGLPGAGATFGRYDLTRRIGRGGMGVVYEATHRDLQRPVALKLLLAWTWLDDEALRNRFIREAQALAAAGLADDRVGLRRGRARRLALHRDQSGTRTATSATYIKVHRGRCPGRVGSVLVQVAEGLADAHEAGFLHRDIKPSNILLQRASATACVR